MTFKIISLFVIHTVILHYAEAMDQVYWDQAVGYGETIVSSAEYQQYRDRVQEEPHHPTSGFAFWRKKPAAKMSKKKQAPKQPIQSEIRSPPTATKPNSRPKPKQATTPQTKLKKGQVVWRKGRECRIIGIHQETNPPSFTVEHLDGTIANTEEQFLCTTNPSQFESRQKPLTPILQKRNESKGFENKTADQMNDSDIFRLFNSKKVRASTNSSEDIACPGTHLSDAGTFAEITVGQERPRRVRLRSLSRKFSKLTSKKSGSFAASSNKQSYSLSTPSHDSFHGGYGQCQGDGGQPVAVQLSDFDAIPDKFEVASHDEAEELNKKFENCTRLKMKFTPQECEKNTRYCRQIFQSFGFGMLAIGTEEIQTCVQRLLFLRHQIVKDTKFQSRKIKLETTDEACCCFGGATKARNQELIVLDLEEIVSFQFPLSKLDADILSQDKEYEIQSRNYQNLMFGILNNTQPNKEDDRFLVYRNGLMELIYYTQKHPVNHYDFVVYSNTKDVKLMIYEVLSIEMYFNEVYIKKDKELRNFPRFEFKFVFTNCCGRKKEQPATGMRSLSELSYFIGDVTKYYSNIMIVVADDGIENHKWENDVSSNYLFSNTFVAGFKIPKLSEVFKRNELDLDNFPLVSLSDLQMAASKDYELYRLTAEVLKMEKQRRKRYIVSTWDGFEWFRFTELARDPASGSCESFGYQPREKRPVSGLTALNH